jgi:hypothetical protein
MRPTSRRSTNSHLQAEELFLVILLTVMGALVGSRPATVTLREDLPTVDQLLDANLSPSARLVVAISPEGVVRLAVEPNAAGHQERTVTLPADCATTDLPGLQKAVYDTVDEASKGEELDTLVQGAPTASYCHYYQLRTALSAVARDDKRLSGRVALEGIYHAP